MLRISMIVLAAAFVFAALPASAAKIASCSSWCLKNRCGVGNMNPQRCMQSCVSICREKHPEAKD